MSRLEDSGYYAELDNESNLWCVFGDNSGFAYASYASKEEAEKKAKEMDERLYRILLTV